MNRWECEVFGCYAIWTWNWDITVIYRRELCQYIGSQAINTLGYYSAWGVYCISQYWIIGKHSTLSLTNKVLIYKAILKPVRNYGIELWGCASPTNISVLQRYLFKLLRPITQAPLYVSIQTLHQDLHIAQVGKVFYEKTLTYRISLSTHPKPSWDL